MEKDSDSVLPYIGLEGPSNHPEPQRSSGKNTLISSPSESPATKASTSQPEEISREKSYCAVPIESPRSQLAKEPPEPEDLRHGIMHIEEGLSKRRYSRVVCLFLCIFTPLIHYPPRCQTYAVDLEGALVFRALEVLSTSTFDYIPMAPHR